MTFDGTTAHTPADRQPPPHPRPGPAPRISRRRLLAAGGAGAVGALASGSAAADPRPAPEAAPGRPAPAAAPAGPSAQPAPAAGRTCYLGTYTSGDGGGTGVGIAAYDQATGELTAVGTIGGVSDPSFLAAAGERLYAVDEYEGSVTAIATDGDRPRVLGSRSTGGSGPCHLSVHAAGGHLLTANYDSGSVAVHPIGADGALGERTDLVQHTGSGPDPDRQSGPHAHMVLNDLAGEYVLAVDLGADTVYTYRLDVSTGTLTAVSQARMAAGSGPRHAAFHPYGRSLYVADELGDSVTVCAYDPATGRVTPGASQPTVPAGSPAAGRNYPAEVVVSADGAFVYVSNRGHDSVAVFAASDDGASLALLDAVPTGGAYPRHIALSPGGGQIFAANQNSGNVTVLTRDPATGRLTRYGSPFAAPSAVCVLPL